MNATKRIAQLIALVLFLVIGLLIAFQNLVHADTEAIAPAQISDVYAVKFDGAAFLTIVLDNVKQPMADDGSCAMGPRVKVVYQYYPNPTLGEPVVQEYSPDQPGDQPGCEIDWQAAEQFADSMHLFLNSKGEQVLVGPIEGLYTDWDILYQDILVIQHEALYTHTAVLPIAISQ